MSAPSPANSSTGTDSRVGVFVSYSRVDLPRAQRIVAALEKRGIRCVIDTRDLPYGEKWQNELKAFIRASDTVVFLVSPPSTASKWCQWELAQVAMLSKRLVPVVVQAVPPEKLPGAIGEIHLFPLDDDADFEARIDALAQVLLIDRAWIREHTRLGERAGQWLAADRADDHLLTGRALSDAEAWLQRRPSTAPPPSQEQLDYLVAGQARAKRRSRLTVASLSAVVVGALLLSALAWWQREVAVDGETVARAGAFAGTAASLENTFPDRSALLAIESTKIRSLPLGEAVIRGSVSRIQYRLVLRGQEGDFIMTAAFAEAGQAVMTYGEKGVALWDAGTGAARPLVPLAGRLTVPPGTMTRGWLSPDGASLATAGGDPFVRIWDVRSGRQRLQLEGHERPVFGAMFSTDGALVLSIALPFDEGGHDGTARVWDATTGATLHTLTGEAPLVWSEWVPGQRQVVTVDGGNEVRLWTLEPTLRHRVLATAATPGLADAEIKIKLSGNGRFLLLTNNEAPLRLLELPSGAVARTFAGKASVGGGAKSILSSAGHVLVTDINRQGALLESPLQKAPQVLEGHQGGLREIAFSPDDRHLATSSYDGTVRLWDVATGRERAVLRDHGSTVISLSFSADSQVLLTAGEDGTARLWSADGTLLRTLSGHEGKVIAAGFATDGRTIITNGADNTVRLWDLDTNAPIREVKLDADVTVPVGRIDGRLVLFAPRGSQVEIVDLQAPMQKDADGQAQVPLLGVLEGHGEDVLSARLSPDGRLLATASKDRTARLWDVASRQMTRELAGHASPVDDVRFSPDGSLVLTRSGRSIHVWKADGTPLRVLSDALPDATGHGDAAFGFDNRTVIATHPTGYRRLFDVAGTRTWPELPAVNSSSGEMMRNLAVSPDGRTALQATTFSLSLVDLSSGAVALALGNTQEGHEANAWMSPDGATVATCNLNGPLRLWDTKTRKEMVLLDACGRNSAMDVYGRGGPLLRDSRAAFSQDGRLLLVIGRERNVRIIDVRGGRELRSIGGLDPDLNHVAFSTDGSAIVTADRSGQVSVFACPECRPLAEQIADLRNRIGRELTEPERRQYGLVAPEPTATGWRRLLP